MSFNSEKSDKKFQTKNFQFQADWEDCVLRLTSLWYKKLLTITMSTIASNRTHL